MSTSQILQVKRFETLDAFRGLAAVMIILFHSRFYSSTSPDHFIRNSYVFVDFFFILSGFVMAYSYMERIIRGIDLKQFVIYRFARLYPLHLFTLLVWLPFVGMKYYLYAHGNGNDPSDINNLVTFLQNLFLLQGFSTETSWNFPSWSIGVEFYTYIVFYAVILFLSRFPMKAEIILLGLFTLLVYVYREVHSSEVYALSNMLRCVSEFFMGVLVFLLYRRTSLWKIERSLVATVLEGSMLGIVLYLVYHLHEGTFYRYMTLFSFAAIIYLFALEKNGLISRILLLNPFQHLGKISYSIYMTHALIVIAGYKIAVSLFRLDHGMIAGIPKGIVWEYSTMVNILLVLVVLLISTWTYSHIELPGQKYIKTRLGDHAA